MFKISCSWEFLLRQLIIFFSQKNILLLLLKLGPLVEGLTRGLWIAKLYFFSQCIQFNFSSHKSFAKSFALGTRIQLNPSVKKTITFIFTNTYDIFFLNHTFHKRHRHLFCAKLIDFFFVLLKLRKCMLQCFQLQKKTIQNSLYTCKTWWTYAGVILDTI